MFTCFIQLLLETACSLTHGLQRQQWQVKSFSCHIFESATAGRSSPLLKTYIIRLGPFGKPRIISVSQDMYS